MNTPLPGRPTWAEVDLVHLAQNFRSIKAFCCGGDIQFMAVVKANAYGHGAVECAMRLEGEGVDWFAVACIEEAVELRQSGIVKPILVLGGIWPGQEISFLNFDLTPVIFTMGQAEGLNDAASRTEQIARIHVKIDTGMNRVGFRAEQTKDAAARLAEFGNLRVDGLMTHFAAADNLSETEFTEHQLSLFNTAVETFLAAGHRPEYIDLANSPGAVVHPSSRAKMIRIGGLLYGLGGDVLPNGVDQPELHPVMALYSRIAMLKTVPQGESIGYGRTFITERGSLIATIPIGYNDGYDRGLSNKGEVIVRGRKVPVVGRVSMDWVTIDVTDVPDVAIGDKVTMIGSDTGLSLRTEDIAKKIDTISYEVTCGIAPRVPRFYIQ